MKITFEGERAVDEATDWLNSRDSLKKISVEFEEEDDEITETVTLDEIINTDDYVTTDDPHRVGVDPDAVYAEILELVNENPGSTTIELAKVSDKKRTSISPALTDLFRRGLVARTRDYPYQYKITDEGTEEISGRVS